MAQTILQYIRSKYPDKDEHFLKHYISKGFVSVNGNIITNPSYVLKGGVEIILENEHLLNHDENYFEIFEMDEKFNIVKPTSRILFFDAKRGFINYLLFKKADVVCINLQPYNIEDEPVELIVGNLFLDDFSNQLKGKFDIVISDVRTNPLKLFGIMEKYTSFFTEDVVLVARSIVSENETISDVKNAFSSSSSFLGFELKHSHLSYISEQALWMLFQKKVIL